MTRERNIRERRDAPLANPLVWLVAASGSPTNATPTAGLITEVPWPRWADLVSSPEVVDALRPEREDRIRPIAFPADDAPEITVGRTIVVLAIGERAAGAKSERMRHHVLVRSATQARWTRHVVVT